MLHPFSQQGTCLPRIFKLIYANFIFYYPQTKSPPLPPTFSVVAGWQRLPATTIVHTTIENEQTPRFRWWCGQYLVCPRRPLPSPPALSCCALKRREEVFAPSRHVVNFYFGVTRCSHLPAMSKTYFGVTRRCLHLPAMSKTPAP